MGRQEKDALRERLRWLPRLRAFIALSLGAFAVVFMVVLPSALAVGKEERDRERRNIEMAEEAILTRLVVGVSPSSRSLCATSRAACVGPDLAELGLALIAARESNTSLGSLAALGRFGIDAGLSESYSCLVLERGKKIQKYLLKLDPTKLREQCMVELSTFKKRHTGVFDDVRGESICRDVGKIEEETQLLREAMIAHRRCPPGDY